ncbi:MAG TPA: hypothetical protein VHR39_00780, partial [Propionibacteriaceae bacterium]|nr:hypothetical protein [Propionibacteriaceae bacterium]
TLTGVPQARLEVTQPLECGAYGETLRVVGLDWVVFELIRQLEAQRWPIGHTDRDGAAEENNWGAMGG